MHEAGNVDNRLRNPAGDEIVGDVEDGESTEFADIGGKFAGEFVTDKVENAEKGKSGYAGRYFAGDSFPVCYDDAGETLEFANGRRDRAGHEPGSTGLFENRVFGLAAEVDVSNLTSIGIATDSVPALAAIDTFPRVEDAQVWLNQICPKCQQCCPVRRWAALHNGTNGQ
ncbi:hypothetical protein RJ641_007388 [Dillenia turbinata]|uniref:Uncharacterized protein n=1 Tax=Dillenia turbinata TaxID=194707 RepID=A0AAN8V687_9MAGN